MAFLIKTSVARKLFQYICKNKLRISSIAIRKIDAKKHFNVSVDACLFTVVGASEKVKNHRCNVYSGLGAGDPDRVIGVVKEHLVSDMKTYKVLSHMDQGCEFKWRSGVKHDASKIMEFTFQNGHLVNGFGNKADLPGDHLYPLYKSSCISRNIIDRPSKYVLLTQQMIGEETGHIKYTSPETWNYLTEHADLLDGRKSSIYRNAPRFAVFGVGDYTFMPWKIVISGLYKNFIFSKIGSYQGKPILVDDTCNMLGFETEAQADMILELVSSEIYKKFVRSLVFVDSKRPITISLLNRISFRQIALEVGKEDEFLELFEVEKHPLELFA